MMTGQLSGRTVAFLVANEGVERVELEQPWDAIANAGGSPVLLAPEAGQSQTFDHLDKAATKNVDLAVGDANVDDFDVLVLPGGVANPDLLRTVPEAVTFVRDFVSSGKPVAAICHGPWTLIEAGVLDGRTLTSWPSLQTDLRNAGGHWVDVEIHIDTNGPGPLISSRNPDDLPAFCAALLREAGTSSR